MRCVKVVPILVISMLCLAAAGWWATVAHAQGTAYDRPPADPGVAVDRPMGFYTWENPICYASIGNKGVGYSGSSLFGFTSGDPTTLQDDNLPVIVRSQAFIYLPDKKKEVGIDNFGRFDVVPNVNIEQQSAYFRWNTADSEDNFDVIFKSTLVRDVFRWEYVIKNKSAFARTIGFRMIEDICFPGNASPTGTILSIADEFPYYFPQAKTVRAVSEYLGAAIPAEWYVRDPENPGPDMNYRPTWGARQPLSEGVTRPSRLVFAKYMDLVTYGWDKIITAQLPENVSKPWPLKMGASLGTESAVGLYYPVVGIPANSTRTITGEIRLDWAKTSTVGHYALGVWAPTWMGYRPGDNPSTTAVENGYFGPDILEVRAWVTNSSLIDDPAVSVTIDTGEGLKLLEGQDRSYALPLRGLENILVRRLADDTVSWRVVPTGTVSGLVPIRVTANFSLGGSTTSVQYVNIPAVPQRTMQPASHFMGFPFGFASPDARVALGLGTGVQLASYDSPSGTYKYAASDGVLLEPGRAYWLKLGSTTPLNLQGAAPVDQRSTYRVALTSGWNALSNPYQFSIELGRCHVLYNMQDYTYDEAIRRGYIRSEVWFWNPSNNTYDPPTNPYPSSSPSTELKPYQGFWLNAIDPVQLVFQPDLFLPAMNPNQPGARARVRGTSDNWQVNLVVQGGGAKDAVNTFGVGSSERDDLSAGDMMEPPAGPGGISAYFPRPAWGRNAGRYAVDLQAPGGEKAWTFAVTCTKANTPVTLRWPDLIGAPADLSLLLLDTVTGQQVSMRTSHGYTFDSGQGGTRTFTLRAGGVVPRLQFIQVQVLAGRGRGTTGVTYTLSAPAAVTLRLRTPTGRLVRTLSPGRATGEAATVLWDGLDAQGRQVPRGLYLGELAAETADGQRVRQTVALPIK